MNEDNKRTFSKIYGLSNERIERCGVSLYHGIRFDALNRLESIFQSGYILPSSKVNNKFTSYDGITKYLYISNDLDENCNMGKYVSVMPYEDDLEFRVFVKENIFFAIKASIKAYETKHVSFNEFTNIKDKDKKEVFYSYAFNEYFVEDGISLNDVNYIGIDSSYFNGNLKETIDEVINLIKHYKINIPFIDEYTNKEIYRLDTKRLSKINFNLK